MFTKLEGDVAILHSKGRLYQCDLYEWQGGLFAKQGGGFVRLRANGGTSVPSVTLKQVTTDRPLFADRFERLVIAPADGAAPLPQDRVLQLTKGDPT